MEVEGFNFVRVRQKLVDGFEVAATRSLYCTLVLIIIAGLVVSIRFNRRPIEFTESIKVSQASREKLKGWLIFGSLFGILFSTLIPAIFFLVGHLYSPRLFVLHLDNSSVDGFNLVQERQELVNAYSSAWLGSLFFLVIFWLFFWILFGLSRGLYAEIQTRRIPNQGARLSARNALIFSAICSVILIAIYLSIGNPSKDSGIAIYAVMLSLLIGLLSGVAWGGFACIQHFVLRVLLWQSGAIPWNYARFLNYASELRFIQRVGGRYRFLHDLLREHFAQLESKN